MRCSSYSGGAFGVLKGLFIKVLKGSRVFGFRILGLAFDVPSLSKRLPRGAFVNGEFRK